MTLPYLWAGYAMPPITCFVSSKRGAHHDHIDRHLDVAERVTKTDALLPRVRDVVEQHEEVEVAVRSGRAGRHGPEDDDARRRGGRAQTADHLFQQLHRIIHTAHHICLKCVL